MPALENARHERFAQEIVKGVSGRDAYKNAGYTVKSPLVADAAASRLLTDVKVKARIAELQERSAKRAEVTAESIIEELEQARALAIANNQSNAAVSASMGKAKVAGLIIEKQERGAPGDFSKMSDGELRDFIAGRVAGIGSGGSRGDISPSKAKLN